jgi:hypothetical protein
MLLRCVADYSVLDFSRLQRGTLTKSTVVTKNTELVWTLVTTLEATTHVLPQLITVVPEVSRIYSLSMDEMVLQQFTMPSEGNDWRLTLVIWPMIIAVAKLKRIGTLAPTTTHNMVDGILGEATKWAVIRCICQPLYHYTQAM